MLAERADHGVRHNWYVVDVRLDDGTMESRCGEHIEGIDPGLASHLKALDRDLAKRQQRFRR